MGEKEMERNKEGEEIWVPRICLVK